MRSPPEDKYDRDELERLNAESWMLEHLKLNPDYTCWGPGEDYMSTKGEGWSSSQVVDSWQEFGPWNLDDLNECVNFYFEIERDSKKCVSCDGSGYSPQAKLYSDQWYGYKPFNPSEYGATPLTLDHPELQAFARRNVERNPNYYGTGEYAVQREVKRLHDMWSQQWCHHLIQADVDALIAENRLYDLTRTWSPERGWQKDGRHPTAHEVNAWSLHGLGHDSINHWVCVRARCEREGVKVECDACDGRGHVYTEPAAHLNLVVWMLHSRKGCSRGVRIKNLSKQDAAAARAWLRKAAERNAERFAKVVNQ